MLSMCERQGVWLSFETFQTTVSVRIACDFKMLMFEDVPQSGVLCTIYRTQEADTLVNCAMPVYIIYYAFNSHGAIAL